jgi:hypothetical protein
MKNLAKDLAAEQSQPLAYAGHCVGEAFVLTAKYPNPFSLTL